MSRSFKKKPYYQLVSMSANHVKNIKRESNRAFRRGLKQGRFDDEVSFFSGNNDSRKIYDLKYTYDYFTLYAHIEDKDKDWYPKIFRK